MFIKRMFGEFGFTEELKVEQIFEGSKALCPTKFEERIFHVGRACARALSGSSPAALEEWWGGRVGAWAKLGRALQDLYF